MRCFVLHRRSVVFPDQHFLFYFGDSFILRTKHACVLILVEMFPDNRRVEFLPSDHDLFGMDDMYVSRFIIHVTCGI